MKLLQHGCSNSAADGGANDDANDEKQQQHYLPLGELASHASFEALNCGSVVLRVQSADGAFAKAICAWMGARSVSAYVCREERIHTLWMLGADASGLCRRVATRRQQKADGGRPRQQQQQQRSTPTSIEKNEEAEKEENEEINEAE